MVRISYNDKGTSSMTRQEFIRSKNRYGYGIVLPGFSALILIAVLPFVWCGIQNAYLNLSLLERITGHGICIGTFVLGLWFVYGRLWNFEKRQQYWCPQCGNGFGGTEDIVLETGKCHYCGFQVIENNHNDI
jgi:hypothetical protein